MKTLGSVESFTGGLFAAKVINQPGASAFFKGALVPYATEIKTKFKIDWSSGLVSAQTALNMAKAGQEMLNVELCVAFTGNAGPEALENKPVGLVYIAFNTKVYRLQLQGDRQSIREQAVAFAYKKVLKLLERPYARTKISK